MSYETAPINTDEATDGRYQPILSNNDEATDELQIEKLKMNCADESTEENYRPIPLNADRNELCMRSYETFIGRLRRSLKSGDKSHDIDLLPKSSKINMWNMFVEVELFYHEVVTKQKVSITLALYVLNANVIAYKSEKNSFFFRDAPRGADSYLFNETKKHNVDVSNNYKYLPDRSKIPLSGRALRNAIGILHDFKNVIFIHDGFRESVVVVLQMVAEAARFEFIKKYIVVHLQDEYLPQGDTISYEDAWGLLSQQIQLSDSDGNFKTAVQVENADYSIKYITDVAQVELAITILHYETIYPTITFSMGDTSDGGYGTFVDTLRRHLISGATSHDIPLLRNSSEVTNDDKFVLVELFYDDASIFAKKVPITLALNVVNAKVIGYKSEANSFFFINAPSGAQDVLFNGTTKEAVNVYASYVRLGLDRSKIPLSTGALKKAIDILYKFNGKNIKIAFKESLVVVMQMVSEATRFKFIEQYIESNLIGDGYTPKGDTISYENKWCTLSKQIQLSGEDGKFEKPVEVQNEDYSKKTVCTVAEVKPYIAILLYKGSRKIGEMSAAGDDEELVDSDSDQ